MVHKGSRTGYREKLKLSSLDKFKIQEMEGSDFKHCVLGCWPRRQSGHTLLYATVTTEHYCLMYSTVHYCKLYYSLLHTAVNYCNLFC